LRQTQASFQVISRAFRFTITDGGADGRAGMRASTAQESRPPKKNGAEIAPRAVS